jgi:hypothetical protein
MVVEAVAEDDSSGRPGGAGGSGIVVVRYQIGQLTATAKATGGAMSFYAGKTIHTSYSSGTFTVTNPRLSSVDYLVVGGGGGGWNWTSSGGGGGAGGYRTGTGIPVSAPPGPYTVTVGAGGHGGVDQAGEQELMANGSNTVFSYNNFCWWWMWWWS